MAVKNHLHSSSDVNSGRVGHNYARYVNLVNNGLKHLKMAHCIQNNCKQCLVCCSTC
jgi:hypothetical protein